MVHYAYSYYHLKKYKNIIKLYKKNRLASQLTYADDPASKCIASHRTWKEMIELSSTWCWGECFFLSLFLYILFHLYFPFPKLGVSKEKKVRGKIQFYRPLPLYWHVIHRLSPFFLFSSLLLLLFLFILIQGIPGLVTILCETPRRPCITRTNSMSKSQSCSSIFVR